MAKKNNKGQVPSTMPILTPRAALERLGYDLVKLSHTRANLDAQRLPDQEYIRRQHFVLNEVETMVKAAMKGADISFPESTGGSNDWEQTEKSTEFPTRPETIQLIASMLDSAQYSTDYIAAMQAIHDLSDKALRRERVQYNATGKVEIGVDYATKGGDKTTLAVMHKDDNGTIQVDAVVAEPTLLRVLDAMRVTLDPTQRAALQKLEKGSVLTVWDVTGVAKERFKGDIQSDDARMAITTGNIAEDILMFMRVEFPGLVNLVLTQSFADDLFIYLRKRGWEDEEIMPNLRRAVDAYEKSLQPKTPPKVEGVAVNSTQAVDIPVDPKGGTSAIQVGGMKWEQGKHYDIVWEGENGTIMWYPDAPRVECCSTCGLPKNPITHDDGETTVWGKCANPECPAFGEGVASASFRFPGDFTGSPGDVTEQPIEFTDWWYIYHNGQSIGRRVTYQEASIWLTNEGEPQGILREDCEITQRKPGADVGGEATTGASSGE